MIGPIAGNDVEDLFDVHPLRLYTAAEGEQRDYIQHVGQDLARIMNDGMVPPVGGIVYIWWPQTVNFPAGHYRTVRVANQPAGQ